MTHPDSIAHASAIAEHPRDTRAANPLTEAQLLAYDKAYVRAKADGSLRRAEVDRDLNKQIKQGGAA